MPVLIQRSAALTTLPSLNNGDHLDQKTFHARYKAMQEHVRAELIGGVVYMASPMKLPHGEFTYLVAIWFNEYELATPGTRTALGVTNILGSDSEPQPDLILRLLPEFGGQSRENRERYLVGPPELIVEISHSTVAIDLHAKKDDYEKAGVREYLVVAIDQKEVFWFQRRRTKFQLLKPDAAGIIRSRIFPGLWLDPASLFTQDKARLIAAVRQGITSKEHATFVASLKRK